MPDPNSLLQIGARLAVTRKALGLTQAEMDRMMGTANTAGQTCNIYEIGAQRIPIHHALALCRTCNITLDWPSLVRPGRSDARAPASAGSQSRGRENPKVPGTARDR